MATRRIKIVIDTDKLVPGQDPSSCIYMLGTSDMDPTQQGQNELGVTINNGDSVIWSPCGFDGAVNVKLIAAASPGILLTNMRTVYNDDGTVTALATSSCNSGIYRFAFTVDDNDFQPYTWDPYMTIQ